MKLSFRLFPIALALLLGLVLALPGCGKTPEPVRYYNQVDNFSICFPDKWKTTEQKGIEKEEGTTAVVSTPPAVSPTDNFGEKIGAIALPLPARLSLDDFCEMINSGMNSCHGDWKFIEQGDATLGGSPAKMFIHSYRQGETSFQEMAYLLIQNAKGYIITFAAPTDTFDRYRPQFDASVKTFRFEKTPAP